MSAKPSDVYEKLKDLRRQGDGTEIRSRIGHQLRDLYNDVVRQGMPDRFAELIRRLDAPDGRVDKTDPSATLIRVLEIKTLADRVFGDEQKAEAWLQRPNSALSGQKPADLVKDELGTAVVRELLERIDHGIFA
jgi:putative toxin-antitoxin system antitoxin component (TIGR02293 family)